MATGVYLSSHKKKRTALLLCIFTGMFGGHYFYVGRFMRGLLAMFTFNFLFIGWLLDIIKIMRGRLKDNDGLPLID